MFCLLFYFLFCYWFCFGGGGVFLSLLGLDLISFKPGRHRVGFFCSSLLCASFEFGTVFLEDSKATVRKYLNIK